MNIIKYMFKYIKNESHSFSEKKKVFLHVWERQDRRALRCPSPGGRLLGCIARSAISQACDLGQVTSPANMLLAA